LLTDWQNTYIFDRIDNRVQAAFNGNSTGGGLYAAVYMANNLNLYASRTVPGYFRR